MPVEPNQSVPPMPAGMTEAERCLWASLSAGQLGGLEFLPQYTIGNYVVDFCALQPRLIIEVDDPQALERDEFYVTRNAWLEAEGWRLLRFTSHDVLKNVSAVLSVIRAAVQKK